MLYPLLTLAGVAFVAVFNVWLGRMRTVQQALLAGTHHYEDTQTELPALSEALQQLEGLLQRHGTHHADPVHCRWPPARPGAPSHW